VTYFNPQSARIPTSDSRIMCSYGALFSPTVSEVFQKLVLKRLFPMVENNGLVPKH
jgi:hypothetical protein